VRKVLALLSQKLGRRIDIEDVEGLYKLMIRTAILPLSWSSFPRAILLQPESQLPLAVQV
jgi:hypothetical protein